MLYCKHECGFLILRNQKGCAMMNKFDFMGKDAVSKDGGPDECIQIK